MAVFEAIYTLYNKPGHAAKTSTTMHVQYWLYYLISRYCLTANFHDRYQPIPICAVMEYHILTSWFCDVPDDVMSFKQNSKPVSPQGIGAPPAGCEVSFGPSWLGSQQELGLGLGPGPEPGPRPGPESQEAGSEAGWSLHYWQ